MSERGPTRRALDAAGEAHRRAVEHNQSGRPALASRAVIRGLRHLGLTLEDQPPAPLGSAAEVLAARLHATFAKSAVEMYGVDEALASMDRARAWAGAAEPELAAFLHSQRGLILFRGGRFGEARLELDRAVELTAPDTVDRCRLLLNRGALLVELGRVDAARTDIVEALELARRLELPVLARVGLHNLGCLELTAGDLPAALRLIDAGLEMDGDTQRGIAHRDRSRVLLAAGLQQEADETLALASVLLSRERCWQDVGEVELTRAESALLRGDTKAARHLAGRARDRFRRYGNDRWRRTAELTLLQADLRDSRPLTRLVPHAHRLVAEFSADGFVTAARVAELLAAEMEEGLGRHERAADLAAHAGQPGDNDPIALRLQARYVQARLRLAEHNKTEARRDLRAGMAELAAYQAQFGSIDLQTASAVHGTRLAELDLEIALADATPAGVLAAIERGRAVSRRLRPVTPPTDDVVAGLLAELRRTVDNLRGKLSDPAAAREVAADRVHIADLQRSLRERSWRTEGLREGARPATASELRAAFVSPDQLLVSYAELGGELHAVVVGEHPRLRRLGPAAPVHELVARVRADLDLLAQSAVPEPIMAAGRRTLARSLDRLDELLIRPLDVAGPRDGTRIVVIPTGRLLVLPWTMLPRLRGRALEVAPSATAWRNATMAGRAGGRARARGSVAAGGPGGADGSAGAVDRRSPVVALIAGPGLARAEEEIAAVAEVWGDAAVLVERDALGLRKALAEADLLHVAAHGEHQPENPMFSALRLVGGPVFAYELDPGPRPAGHVVLSACDLGRTTVRAGDEPLGLTSALLHLGTRSVVAGVARVNDDVAASVMVHYHRHLAAGTDSATALARASEREATERPAPFVNFGAAWQV